MRLAASTFLATWHPCLCALLFSVLSSCAVSGEAELYLAFDPLTDKSEAAGVCSRLGMWLHARHDMLFF